MRNSNRIIALIIIIGVIQVCTCDPIPLGEEKDATKLFTTEELQLAKNAGITEQELLNGKELGLTVEETAKIYIQANNEPTTDRESDVTTFAKLTKLCEILVPGHKVATNYTSAQEALLDGLMNSAEQIIPRENQFPYVRTSVCAYMSEPFVHEMDASNFGLKLIPYMKFRFSKMISQNATGIERVNVAKELCCIYNGQENISEFEVQSNSITSSDEKMADFEKYWNEFETAKTSTSFKQVCNFLRTGTASPSGVC